MGVNGLWQVVQPCARPTNLATLNRKRLAVDASIWIYQFLKAVRDKEGNSLRNSHVVGFFRRICKLLWYGILPVFVFDGGAPALKRQTILARKRRREGRREDAVKTAGKLLAVQMHRRAEEEEAIRKKKEAAGPMPVDENEEPLPDMNNVVYVEELGMSKQERMRNRKFHKQDPYHLPTIDTSLASMARPEDPRIMSIEELEEYARNFNSGEDINLYDFSKIDFGGDFFKSLPSVDRYNILNAARLRSRLRMGLSKEQLEDMFPDRMAFSRFQIERVRERNNLTQRLMQEAGMTGLDLTINGSGRIAGDKDREYILVKNEGAEGGWALGVVSKDRDLGESHKPIDVDALQFEYQKKSEPEEDDEDDFEDVPIPGLNRLPPINQNTGPVSAAADLEARERYVRQRLHDFTTNDGNAEPLDEDPDSLFVGQDIDDPQFPIGGESGLYTEEEDDINKAIALSLQSQHGIGNQPESSLGEGEPEEPEIAAPVWKQRAAETPTNPIMTKSGRMVAHIVNNRANAAVARQRVVNTRPGNEGDSDSDSSVDLQRTLAKSNKSRKEKPGKSDPNASNPFGGPLPFPKLDWQPSLFSKRSAPEAPPKPPQHNLESADGDAAMDELPGGFEREPHDDKAPKPLPPWLVHDGDIRDSLKHQKTLQEEMNAEDRDMAIEKQQEWERQQRDEILEISSSDEESNDVELVEDPTSLLEDIPIDPALTMSGAISSEATLEVAAHASPDSPEPEFENVGILNEAAAASVPPTLTVEITSDLEKRAPQGSLHPTEEMMLPTRMSAKPSPEAKSAEPSTKNDDFLFNDDDDASVEDDEEEFSDPEEAELLVQMEAEAQEHARFASELNSKSTQENLRDYEMELRQLRTQQKKDRRDADEVNSTMVAECQALLGLFGIPYITAPMEAEAQCAELVSLGLVDGIVTDDSDIFLFGGTRVYKNMFSTNKFVECYLSSDLEREMSLSREQLVSLAQLLGSDYTEGLAGVGPVTAVEIISEFSGPTGLDDFRTWWDDVQCNNRPREADADKPFRRKFRKSQATKLFLPPGFPSPAVTEAYLEPEVDHSNEAFQWGVPDVEGLRQFLMNTIGWGKARTDEVLLPVVKDINRREIEGTQANITRFFEGSVGTGRLEAFAPRQRTTTSKRMTDAVSKLRQRTLVDSMGVQTEASGQGPSTSVPAVTSRAKQPRKRQRRDTAIEESDEDGPAEHEDSADVNKRSGAGRGKKARA